MTNEPERRDYAGADEILNHVLLNDLLLRIKYMQSLAEVNHPIVGQYGILSTL